MQLYTLTDGVARREGAELAVLDLPHPDIGALIADDIDLARTARVRHRRPLEGTALAAVVPHPANLVLNGLIFRGHAAEAGLEEPAEPRFVRAGSGPLDAPGAPIVLPSDAPGEIDYEGEIALVIGHAAQDVPDRDAWRTVAGLTVVNDVSDRAGQRAAMSGATWDLDEMVRAKRRPTFKPCGPALVTTDEFDPEPDLTIETLLNGVTVQRDSTRNMLFGFSEVVSAISRSIPLRPGDVICTGTPAGVGSARGRYLADGDTVTVRVSGVGQLVNPVLGPRR
ncbi:fumarylacetoacetate hydrolase family protein [Pseudonocardia thermophila]|jgi:2-keto-4-pentenoate hydratase/2-oxohepta-3-ene-1,7-dioic acid hydratase (catechol pathway)|uniref:fumarylacetoacetate hydrolase family protein n=1 Tax=Pseudonocardia thermophila TaxID=1848 RepID=UPI00248E8673|nr:fumarylacetoacetate hydrolase family protein [Pseudonocardia thermophila]